MADVTKFVLDGTTINVSDPVASATAQAATVTANNALKKAEDIEKLSRLTVSYNES